MVVKKTMMDLPEQCDLGLLPLDKLLRFEFVCVRADRWRRAARVRHLSLPAN